MKEVTEVDASVSGRMRTCHALGRAMKTRRPCTLCPGSPPPKALHVPWWPAARAQLLVLLEFLQEAAGLPGGLVHRQPLLHSISSATFCFLSRPEPGERGSHRPTGKAGAQTPVTGAKEPLWDESDPGQEDWGLGSCSQVGTGKLRLGGRCLGENRRRRPWDSGPGPPRALCPARRAQPASPAQPLSHHRWPCLSNRTQASGGLWPGPALSPHGRQNKYLAGPRSAAGAHVPSESQRQCGQK